jgi:hypothetical protein
MYSSVQRPYARKWAYAWSQTSDVSSLSVDDVPFNEYFFDRLANLNVRIGTELILGSFAQQDEPVSASSIPLAFTNYDPYQYTSSGPLGGYWRKLVGEVYGGEFLLTGGNSDGSWAGLIAGMRGGTSPNPWDPDVPGPLIFPNPYGFVLDVKTSAGLEVDLSQMQFQLGINLYSSLGTRICSGVYNYTGSALTGNGNALLERATMSPMDLVNIVYLTEIGPR